MHCDFLGSDGLQETHMNAFKPFNFKLVTLTMKGGFFTKFSALAHGAPPHVHQGQPSAVGTSGSPIKSIVGQGLATAACLLQPGRPKAKSQWL